MPRVAEATPSVGTIQGTDEDAPQPNQNKPIGRNTDSTQLKYSRPSGAEESFPIFDAALS